MWDDTVELFRQTAKCHSEKLLLTLTWHDLLGLWKDEWEPERPVYDGTIAIECRCGGVRTGLKDEDQSFCLNCERSAQGVVRYSLEMWE